MSHPSETIQIACPHCGTVLETEESIAGAQIDCPECGKAFLAAPIQPEPVPTVSAAPQNRPRTSRSPKKVWAWILAVVLVLAAGGGAMWWLKGWPSRPQSASSSEKAEAANGVEPLSQTRPAPANPKKAPPPETAKPVLSFQSVREYCKKFGGRGEPSTCSFTATESALHPSLQGTPYYYHVRRLSEDGEVSLAGNPIYFYRTGAVWTHYEADSGNGHVFVRKDCFVCDDDPERIPNRRELCSAVIFYARAEKEFARDLGLPLSKLQGPVSGLVGKNGEIDEDAVVALCMNSLWQSRIFPAPVVFAPKTHSERFCYLNESGTPSALIWGTPSGTLFCCFEGEDALGRYARCLRELRETLAKNTQIAKEEGLSQWNSPLSPKVVPEVYLGDIGAGTREKATLGYEFVVEPEGKEVRYQIKQTVKTQKWSLSFKMDSKTLEEEWAFFSQFETSVSTEKAFAPLYCFLSQQKILVEEAEEDAGRVARRFGGGGSTGEGKKQQELTFAPMGPQTQNARVELDATAASGGKVVFSVESGPGKIEGKMLTFTGTGKVVVRARQWGDAQWRSATVTQEVEVKSDERTNPQRERESTPEPEPARPPSGFGQSGSAPRTTGGQKAPQKIVMPELKNMAGVFLDLKANRSAANLSKLEKEWKMLPPEPKRLLQKNVMWISGAMLLQHGKTDALAQRKALLDIRALTTAVSDECPSCHGRGKSSENCRTCGGTGRCAFCHGSGRTPRMNGQTGPCPKCNSGGRCLDCTGGKKESRCRECGGSGRMLSEHKCQNVIEENIAGALRICRGEE